MSATRGRFITIEGGEGVGKSVLLRGLVSALLSRGLAVVATHEPGGTPVAETLRRIFASPPEGERLLIQSELFLVSAARSQHVAHVIRPALAAGKWVLCDRFADSSRVYQGMLGGVGDEFLERVIAESTGSLDPDLTFLLDCPVDVSLARMRRHVSEQGERGGVDRYDDAGREVHEKMRRCYGQLVTRFPARLVKLDAEKPPEALVAAAIQALAERFKELT